MLKRIMIAAVAILVLAPAAMAQTAPARTGTAPADGRRQSVLAERKTAESQYRQDRIAALRKGDDCIKASGTQKALADCEKAEAGELKAATDKAKAARAKARRKDAPPKAQ